MGKIKKSPDEMTFLEHLEDLRKRLFNSFLAIIITLIPSWFFSRDVFRILARPVTKYLPEGTKLAYTGLTEPFLLYLKVSFLTAIFVSSPFIFLQIWYFVAPGLYQREKRLVIPFVIATTFFFLLGATFGYLVIFPWACRFFLNLGSDFQSVITVNSYFNLSLKLLLGIGLVFEMPILVFFLAKIGVASSRWMLRNFKYAVLVIFIIAAIITPTPDMITQSILAIPMLLLYGLSILVVLFVEKAKRRKQASEAALIATDHGEKI